MISSTFFLVLLGVVTLIYAPKAVQFQYRITRRWQVYWDLVNRSKAALKEGNAVYSRQLRNLSKRHLQTALRMERRRRAVAVVSLLMIGGAYGAMSAIGIIAA